ncbi:uncharacterized protein LOC109840929 [Asparagus officinalis]|uniref:uncharacterized protein LOC109840929 n=1 Tax=Asparagus officinalis TaxID=4686 RepID=UPI00098DE72E|nr:uncharacterized protein LOC109840929 [Asparagus officinalis]
MKESAPPVAKRRGGPGGLSKVCGVSPELQAIVGEPAMPRTQIVKQLWAYIRKNNLQDPNNKRKIICNDELRLVFETDSTDMFKMNKLLAKHILPLDETKDTGPDAKKLKTEDVGTATEPDAHEQPLIISASEQPAVNAATEQLVVKSASEEPVVVSDTLAMFLGAEAKEMLQSEALKHILDYVKDNHLEDPVNTTMIHCDARLQQLFGCESFSTLSLSEMLACHLFKKS